MPFPRTCETCGVTFMAKARPTVGNPYRFCSNACRYAARGPLPGSDGSVRIPLTHGEFAIVDAEDAERLVMHSWSFNATWGGAFRRRRNDEPPGTKTIWMHRVILDVPDGVQVKHRNHDRLDNRKVNLRLLTPRPR